ncbi:isochorismate synthase (plasmid) [Salipiger sp. CCB-MM3]|uniref:isochorismate synthase n=1 Tax=Salipiger sp. CCB-MM3 TaxID=1792508 RepID=UPI00080AA3B7|nr:isochorismate synthase [Salipiger sp. CCB-MM3]ANT63220.1 isochorismate synthase [Salipiger sp. CCB-MM3]
MTRPLTHFDTRPELPGPGLAFLNGRDTRIARGPLQPVPRGDAASLGARLAPALAALPQGGMIGGALPFDRAAEDCLWSAEAQGGHLPVGAPAPTGQLRLTPEPQARDYAAAVAAALAEMQANPALEKVVLARTLRLESTRPIDRAGLLARLAADPAVTAFDVALPGGRHLVGGTPELLLDKRGAEILSHPLAGSARRSTDAREDRAAAEALAGSEKDQREHALVVEFILDTLAPLCRTLGAPEGTCITSTGSMWHLGTRIAGQLREKDQPAPVLAACLHPTPAVCGLPRDPAAELIRQLEPVQRDFYAGAVGWCDARGDGAWHVAIRCAELQGTHARLYAGAGIVPGSDPDSETRETGAKFGAMLSAFGLAPDAALNLT